MEIKKIDASKAAEIITYCKQIGKESPYLTFGKEGIPLNIEQEEAFLNTVNKSHDTAMFGAFINNEIVGCINITGSNKERLKHVREIGISVKKEYWNQGIGDKLIKTAVEFAKEVNIDILNLEVRSDNQRAINLYKKNGFVKTGTFYSYIKIDNKYYDCDIMQLFIKDFS